MVQSLLSRTPWAVTPLRHRRRLIRLLLTAIVAFVCLVPPPMAQAADLCPAGDHSGSTSDGRCEPVPPTYINDTNGPQVENAATRWLPSLRYQNLFSGFHTRYDSGIDGLDDLPDRATTGMSGTIFGFAAFLAGLRSNLTVWAMYSRSWLEGSVGKIDSIWSAVGSAVQASGLLGIAIIAAIWLAVWRYMWRTTIMTIRTVAKDVAIAVGCMMLFNVAMGEAQNARSTGTCQTPTGTQYECPTQSLSPGGITLKLANGIDQLASAPSDALSTVCQDVCDASETPTYQYDAISCPAFYEYMRGQFSESVTAALGGSNSIEQTALLVDDRITMATMGKTWMTAQFGDIDVGNRVGCIQLESTLGTSDRQMERMFEAAGWPTQINVTAFNLGSGKTRDRRMIAWMACGMKADGTVILTPQFSDVRPNGTDRTKTMFTKCQPFLTQEGTVADNPEDAGADGAFNFEGEGDIRDDTIIRSATPDYGNVDTSVCNANGDGGLEACNTIARTSIMSWQGHSSGITISAAIIALLTQVLLLVTSLFRSLGALFSVIALVAIVPTFGPIALAIAAFPGRSTIVRQFGKRVLVMSGGRALFVLQGALQAAIAMILMSIFAPDGIWGVLWIGGTWVAAALVVHKMMKTMGMPSVMTPSGAFAVAAGSVAGGAVAWQTSKGVGRRAAGRVNKGLGLSKSARADKNRRDSWAKGAQGAGAPGGTRDAKGAAAGDGTDSTGSPKPGGRSGPAQQAQKRLAGRAVDRARDTRGRAAEKADRLRNWRGDKQAAKTAARATPRPAGVTRSAHKRAVMARTTEQRQSERRVTRNQRWESRQEQQRERGDLNAVHRQESRERGKRMILNGWATGIDEREAERSKALGDKLRKDAEHAQARQAERDARRAQRQTQRSTRRTAPPPPAS